MCSVFDQGLGAMSAILCCSKRSNVSVMPFLERNSSRPR